MRLLACLIVAPQRGYDEPATLSYAISSFCPTSADGLHEVWLLCATMVQGMRTSQTIRESGSGRSWDTHQFVCLQAYTPTGMLKTVGNGQSHVIYKVWAVHRLQKQM